LLERSNYDQVRIGETLPPIARVPLTGLGVWGSFVEQGHAPSPATVAAWGQPELEENHFIFNPHGHGWHLDRQRFDEMLAAAASEAGADVHRGARMTACQPNDSGGWRVEYTCAGIAHQLQAGFLVDATGRAALLARQQGAKRIRCDRLAAVIGMFTVLERDSEQDYRTLVESAAEGWWYSARLPQSQLVVAYMTDADLLPQGQTALHEHWQTQLEKTEHTRLQVNALSLEKPLRLAAAGSELLDRMGGQNWLAVGDAAVSFDPLSSQGIYLALKNGLLAAEAITEFQHGSRTKMDELSLWLRKSFQQYWQTRLAHYAREQRWRDSPFWQRRQRANPALTQNPQLQET
jgi:flavin-dependent dehydrogenase